MESNVIKTPFPRLLTGISIASFGYIFATVLPIALLLPIKLAMLDPANVTRNFSILSIITAFAGIAGLYGGGMISDRTSWSFGRRRSWILIGAILGAIALYGVGTAGSFTVVCILFPVAKFFYNFMNSALYALVPDQVEENKRGPASGVMGLISPLAIMIGMNIMNLFNSSSIVVKFSLLGIVSVVFAIISCLLVKEGRVEYKRVKDRDETRLSEKLSKIYPNPRKYPYFTFGVLTRFFMSVAYAVSTYTSVYYLEHFHVAQEELTGIVALNMNITVPLLAVFSVVGGFLSDKFRRQKPFVFTSALIVAIGIVGYSIAPSIPFSYLCGAIVSIGFGSFLAVDIALMTRLLPNPEDSAKDMGIVNIANDLGAPVTNVLATPLVTAGGYPLFFGILSIFALLAGIVVKPIPELEKKSDTNIKIAN